MIRRTRGIATLALALPLGVMLLSSPAFAQHHHHGGGGGWVAPFVGGAILGGALGAYGAYNYPYYSPPAYYPPPAYYAPPAPRWCYDYYGRAYQC